MIAYTSDFIPRMVYKYVYSPDNTLNGYVLSTLSAFNTSEYTEEMGSPADDVDPPFCYYRGNRQIQSKNPTAAETYELTPLYWHTFAARLAFVVIFEVSPTPCQKTKNFPFNSTLCLPWRASCPTWSPTCHPPWRRKCSANGNWPKRRAMNAGSNRPETMTCCEQ